jgi:hypothetical protein
MFFSDRWAGGFIAAVAMVEGGVHVVSHFGSVIVVCLVC